MDSSDTKYFQLGPFTAPKLWIGLWQLSSPAWGSAPVSRIRHSMDQHLALGYNAFGMRAPISYLSQGLMPQDPNRHADHYGGAEIIFGKFRSSLSDPNAVIGATKLCIFRPVEPTREYVEGAVRERMTRMGTTRVDLLQFHWNDYGDKRYLTALQHLQDLRREGLITAIGLCNFDTVRADEICTQLGPDAIVSNQVQFSIIDTRPLHGMSDVCERHGLKLLTYGTLCGGFLSDTWLGKPEPQLYGGDLNPSQRKYLDVIVKAWGSWELFQSLLRCLRIIADQYAASIANVALRWVLDHSFVGGVLIGVRLGLSEHADENQKVFSFHLSKLDRERIEDILSASNSSKMIFSMGDCGAEYRAI